MADRTVTQAESSSFMQLPVSLLDYWWDISAHYHSDLCPLPLDFLERGIAFASEESYRFIARIIITQDFLYRHDHRMSPTINHRIAMVSQQSEATSLYSSSELHSRYSFYGIAIK